MVTSKSYSAVTSIRKPSVLKSTQPLLVASREHVIVPDMRNPVEFCIKDVFAIANPKCDIATLIKIWRHASTMILKNFPCSSKTARFTIKTRPDDGPRLAVGLEELSN